MLYSRYMDTGLTNQQVVLYGLIGVGIGMALIAVPLVLWLATRKR